MSDALSRLSARVAHDPRFMAHGLTSIQERMGFSDAMLAHLLALPEERLPYLRLCRLPRPDHYQADVTRIATYAGCEAERLAELLTALEVHGA